MQRADPSALMLLSHAEVVGAARTLMERTDPSTAGLWPRATALPVRGPSRSHPTRIPTPVAPGGWSSAP